MGLLNCYWCWEPLQTIKEANHVRYHSGKREFFNKDGVLVRWGATGHGK
jgi:hypothetical protein